jgi:hypothetical protein
MGNWYIDQIGGRYFIGNTVIDYEICDDGTYRATKESLKNYEETYPAFMISRATGIKVHHNWRITRDLTNRLMTRLQYSITQKEYDEIIKLNPILTDIKLVNKHSPIDVCVGVLSKFNFYDIKEFIESNYTDTEEKTLLSGYVERELKLSFSYRPSLHTLRKLAENIELAKSNTEKYFKNIKLINIHHYESKMVSGT